MSRGRKIDRQIGIIKKCKKWFVSDERYKKRKRALMWNGEPGEFQREEASLWAFKVQTC